MLVQKSLVKFISRHKFEVALVILLLIAAFFRFYNAPLRYSLGDESIRDAMVGIVGAKTLQAPLTGPFSSLGPFTFGPWYWYQLILFHLLFPVAYSSWIYLGIMTLVYIVLLYKIGERLGDKVLGIILAFFAAFSPAQISSATGLTNPNMIHAFAALALFLFLKLLEKKISLWFAFFMGLSIGIGISLHYQMAIYGILALSLLVLRPKQPLYALCAFLGIAVTFIPFGLFDLTNNWYMIKTILFYYVDIKNRIYVPNSWTIYIRDFWPYFWSTTLGVSNLIALIFIIASVVVFPVLFIKRKLSRDFVILLIMFAIMFIQLRYYSGERFLGYVHYLQPFIFLFSGYLLWRLIKVKLLRWGGILVGILLLGLILPQSFERLRSEPNLVEAHAALHNITQAYNQGPIQLYHCEGIHKGRTFDLLFLLYKDNRLGDSDTRVGLADEKCIQDEATRTLLRERILYEYKGGGSYVVDFRGMDERLLEEHGWYSITPQIVYDSSTKWWYKDLEHR